MRIKPTPMLDYPDVLFEPKRSSLPSRGDIDLEREIKFPHSPNRFKGTPIIAANMDGVGTFSMALELQKHKVMTCIRKHYTPEDWDKAFENGLKAEYTIICTGSNAIWDPDAKDYATTQEVLRNHPELKYICIDVANGYQENFSSLRI
jgi:GMP reductase